jgi:LytS/YehU family sensor histidine kinase
MLYETSKPLVKIAEEIKILDDFIDLEKMRYTSRLSVRFEKVIDNDREHISPLLLLPFVENAFKHGASESRFDSNISISLSLTLPHRVLHFVVENTKENINTDFIPDGLGLSNVKRQLQLLYKDFTMNVYNEPSTFKVELTIKLDSYAKS